MFLVVLGQNERALNWDACLKYEQEINCNQELGHLETLSIRMHIDEPVTVPRMHGVVPFHVQMVVQSRGKSIRQNLGEKLPQNVNQRDAPLISWKLQGSRYLKVLTALMISCLIISQASCRNCAVKPSGP
jgi:hypothetical protein